MSLSHVALELAFILAFFAEPSALFSDPGLREAYNCICFRPLKTVNLPDCCISQLSTKSVLFANPLEHVSQGKQRLGFGRGRVRDHANQNRMILSPVKKWRKIVCILNPVP